ncbi:MAG: HAD-IC family P-type ATPase [Crocosphaera sp.]|nr:HAD-IC family P-type ATPase [Crocosphaera sp.]
MTQLSLIRISPKYAQAYATVACAILVILGLVCFHFSWVGVGIFIFTAAYVIGGYESTKEGITTLWEEKELDVDLLMIVAALGAAGLGLWRQEYHLIVDGAILILIFAISGALESFAMERTERNIQSLMAVTPDTARVIDKEGEKNVAISQLQVGDRVLVKPGEMIPTDGIIIEGESTIDQASITGESVPVDKMRGDEVFAGTLNGNGVLIVRVDQPPESSLIQRVIRLVEQAQTQAPPSQEFVERFERGYSKVIVCLAILFTILPPFILGWDWETTIYRMLIFLVVASPCALMASIMPTLLSGIATGARQGILFKNGAQLEKMGRVKAIAFDKTGTLTLGHLEVVDIIPVAQQSKETVLSLAASVESGSEHPIGQAIVEAAKTANLVWENGIKIQAKTDTIKPEAHEAIAALKKLGIKATVMVTGDNKRTAQSVGEMLNLDVVHGQLLPEDKLAIIGQLEQQYQTVAMVGDGINDAPALAAATVGVAMGVGGTDVALESADIVLMSDNLGKLSQAIELGRRANGIIKQNITFALFFIFLLLLANFVGSINLPLGVIGHEGSTLLVTLNGLRLLR